MASYMLVAAVITAIFFSIIGSAVPTEQQPIPGRFTLETRVSNTTIIRKRYVSRLRADPHSTYHLVHITVAGQIYKVLPDTGSSDFWIPSDKLPPGQRGSHPVYRTRNQSKIHGYTFSVEYADGNMAEGSMYAETVVIGGLTIRSMPFGAAEFMSLTLSWGFEDGILGLAFRRISSIKPPGRIPTFWECIRGKLDRPLFAVALGLYRTGTIDFGFIDHSKYVGQITSVPVYAREGHWMVIFDGIEVNHARKMSRFTVVIDTGSEMIHLRRDIVEAYYSQVPNAREHPNDKYWYFPCEDELPDLTLFVETHRVVIPGKYLNFGRIKGSLMLCSGIVQEAEGGEYAVLGLPFLGVQYVIFEPEIPRMGFAQLAV
ncbi:hypothetical protein ACJ72_03163 [Emergomyces africanus]|uniref:Peptidase A1 domain-containing protein n=1 Tax=Emergomyces africanus TaxID=1955775 RepID=A0A1B7P0D3_9EURO|nr:hypothetical protein ACJ72_03163 [Emergomyces africanus]